MKYRNVFYGIAAIWIVIYHIHQYRYFYLPIVTPVIQIGEIGVDVFLFLSAIGLSFSIEKNSTKTFYINRLKRIVIPFLMVGAVRYFIKYFAIGSVGISNVSMFLFDLSTLSFWFLPKGEFWYVSYILIAYLLFPYLYRLYKRNRRIIIVLSVVAIVASFVLRIFNVPFMNYASKAFARIPIFLIGIYFSDFVKNNKKISVIEIVAAFFISITLIVLCPITSIVNKFINDFVFYRLFLMYFYLIISISLIVVGTYILNFAEKFKVIKLFIKLFAFFGTISLEIYLVHAAIIRTIQQFGFDQMYHAGIHYIGILLASIILAFLVNKLSDKILKI
jgi:peptidoglycan/LPS O-acetylase OafA/YrhL